VVALRGCKSIELAKECPLKSLSFSGQNEGSRAFFHKFSGHQGAHESVVVKRVTHRAPLEVALD
jgi:hypothetical protein